MCDHAQKHREILRVSKLLVNTMYIFKSSKDGCLVESIAICELQERRLFAMHTKAKRCFLCDYMYQLVLVHQCAMRCCHLGD